jgi:ornithine cyclodeaminase/alanine dehydrogenase-like protein (mu-crystallin family)
VASDGCAGSIPAPGTMPLLGLPVVKMNHIDSNTIGNAAPISEWVAAMEKAFLDTEEGRIEVPRRVHLNRGKNSLLLMPCFGERYFSTKLVSVFPGNLQKKKPVINGTVILNDGATGEPLASFDGGKLTAMRTAAVGSVGIKYLAREKASTLGIIGLGIQGIHQALFACQQKPIRELRVLDRNQTIIKRFTERFNAFYREVKVIACRNALELCRSSEIIITATGSHKPVVPAKGRWWKGKVLIGIGSYKPEMREFPDEVIGNVPQIFVDTLHGLEEAGDLVVPLRNGTIAREQIIPISDLISGKVQPLGDTRFLKSVGMAAFDLYGARLVYENIS